MMATIRHISDDQNELELTNGKKYKAVESDGACVGCSFMETGPCDLVPCGPEVTLYTPRRDERHVIFKEQESDSDNEG